MSQAPPPQDPCQVCAACGELKPLDQFHREAARPNGRNRHCKPCRNARNRELVAADRKRRRESMARWQAANPERYAAARRDHKFRKYGMTTESYEQLLLRQQGVCAICGDSEKAGWDLAIDHDHTTGYVRGLLCRRCNVALGLLRDDARTVAAAAVYLRRAVNSQPPASDRSR